MAAAVLNLCKKSVFKTKPSDFYRFKSTKLNLKEVKKSFKLYLHVMKGYLMIQLVQFNAA